VAEAEGDATSFKRRLRKTPYCRLGGARRPAIPHERRSGRAEAHQSSRSRSGVFVCFVRSRHLPSSTGRKTFQKFTSFPPKGETKPGHVPRPNSP
jgi:hypothetical protein